MKLPDRIFAGLYPCGIVYADREREVHGDYKRLAFLSYSTLELEIERSCDPVLAEYIRQDAANYQTRAGEHLQVSTSGQTVLLGKRISK